MRFYKLDLGSKNTTCSTLVTTAAYQGKIHFSTTAGMRLNHHGNFKVQRFQLFEQIKKDDCGPSPTVPHLPLLFLGQENGYFCWSNCAIFQGITTV